MTRKLTDAEMRLFCLGAALYSANKAGARIIADALDEATKPKPKRAIKTKRRPKQ